MINTKAVEKQLKKILGKKFFELQKQNLFFSGWNGSVYVLEFHHKYRVILPLGGKKRKMIFSTPSEEEAKKLALFLRVYYLALLFEDLNGRNN